MDFQLNLDSETVSHLNPIRPLCIDVHVPVREVFDQLKQLNRSAAMICRDAMLVGIFTERDALRLIATGADLDVPVETVMARDPVCLLPTDTVGEAVARMSRGGYRRLPIVDGDGTPVGVISVRHILHYLVGHFPAAIYTLPPTPDQAPREREGA